MFAVLDSALALALSSHPRPSASRFVLDASIAFARRLRRLDASPRFSARRRVVGHSSPAAHCAFHPPLRFGHSGGLRPPRLLAIGSSVRAPFRSRWRRALTVLRFPLSMQFGKSSSPRAAPIFGLTPTKKFRVPRTVARYTLGSLRRSENSSLRYYSVRSFRLRPPC